MLPTGNIESSLRRSGCRRRRPSWSIQLSHCETGFLPLPTICSVDVGIRGIGVEAIAGGGRHEQDDAVPSLRVEGRADRRVGARHHRAEGKSWDEIVAAYPGDPSAQLVDWSRRTAATLAEMEERGSALHNALAELPEPDHPARRVIDEHRQREHTRILALCREAGFAEPDLTADEFYFCSRARGRACSASGSSGSASTSCASSPRWSRRRGKRAPARQRRSADRKGERQALSAAELRAMSGERPLEVAPTATSTADLDRAKAAPPRDEAHGFQLKAHALSACRSLLPSLPRFTNRILLAVSNLPIS